MRKPANRVLCDTIKMNRPRKINPIIAEIKVYSPKYGDLLRGRDPLNILKIYEQCGVVGISYITAPEFKGDFKLFQALCRESSLPVLRKDFITDKSEIERTREAGASAILLITGLLKERLPEFVDYALKQGLDTLVEVHTVDEVGLANRTKTTMIGINNRDITKLEADNGSVALTEKLQPEIKKEVVKVSESGIATFGDLSRALRNVDAVLVGTAFMMAKNIEEFVRNFVEGEVGLYGG